MFICVYLLHWVLGLTFYINIKDTHTHILVLHFNALYVLTYVWVNIVQCRLQCSQ